MSEGVWRGAHQRLISQCQIVCHSVDTTYWTLDTSDMGYIWSSSAPPHDSVTTQDMVPPSDNDFITLQAVRHPSSGEIVKEKYNPLMSPDPPSLLLTVRRHAEMRDDQRDAFYSDNPGTGLRCLSRWLMVVQWWWLHSFPLFRRELSRPGCIMVPPSSVLWPGKYGCNVTMAQVEARRRNLLYQHFNRSTFRQVSKEYFSKSKHKPKYESKVDETSAVHPWNIMLNYILPYDMRLK